MIITIFTDKVSTPKQTDLVQRFIDHGYAPLIDSTTKDKSVFLKKYKDSVHMCFFTSPCIIIGEIDEVDFTVSGPPHFIIHFNEDDPKSEQDWQDISIYLDSILLDGTGFDTSRGKELCVPSDKTLPLNEIEHVEDTDLVKHIDAKNIHYLFETRFLEELDIMIVSVTKPYVYLPFTIICKNYSVNGNIEFFTDLFVDPQWGNVEADKLFLEYAWPATGNRGELDIDSLLKQRSLEFLPEDGIAKSEPIVYRKSIEDVLKETKFGKKVDIDELGKRLEKI